MVSWISCCWSGLAYENHSVMSSRSFLPILVNRTDHVLPETRSNIMRAVKSKGARSTERRLRAAIIVGGIKCWQMHTTELPGKPDFIFQKESLAVFVDGCFWHGWPKCNRRPHSRQDYWDAKVAGNVSRDQRTRQVASDGLARYALLGT